MERASNLSPNEQVIETVLALQVDPTESTSTDSSSEEKRPDCTMFGGYTVDTAKVEVPDITPAVSQEDYFPTEAPCSMKQREKQLSLAIVGCGSQEEVILNVRGLVSEFTKKEADLEELHQKEKHGVHRYCNNGVLAVYYVDKPPVIQLLRACDQSTQLDLFLCLEDTTETGTWNDSVNRSNNSKMTEQEQSDCAKDINQLQENQELEGVPGVVSDFCSNQVLMQRVGRRYRKNRRGTVSTTCIAMPQLSSEEIRMNVCNSFQAILLHRLRGANHLSINEDVVQAIATNIEKELFLLFFCTNTRYKNKYRSLMFNLKDPRNTFAETGADTCRISSAPFHLANEANEPSVSHKAEHSGNTQQHLFRQVLLGEITPQHLVLMSPTELASLELMKWRERENKHSIKLITTESEEFGRQPLIKLTHKGEIEIERDTDQNLTLEDLMGNSPKSTGSGELSDSDGNRDLDTTHRHRSHLLDFNCQICTGNQSISSQGRRTLSDHPMVVPTGSLRSLPQTTGNHSLLCDASTVAPPANRRLRRSEEPWMTSHLPDYTTYTSTNEITSCHFKYFSPIGSRAGSTTLANSPMRPKRFNSGAHAVWKGFIQTSNMKQFLVKAYPVLGHTNHLTKVLSTIIAVRKCVPSEPIWDSVDKLEPSKTKEICIVRFKPATVGDSVLYTSYYSYLNSRQRYGVVFLEQNSPQRLYLLPLPALQKLPSRLPPLSGPGLESSHPDLLLAMAFSKKQQPEDAFRKSHQHRRGPERCLRQNKPRQKYIEGIDKECPGDHSQLSPLSAKPGDQPHILPVLPAIPFMPQRELFHPSCQIQPSDLLLGDILSSEELLSCTDLSNITAAEILQSFCNDKQESDGMGNSNGPSAFTNDGLDANLGVNEGHHGVASRKGNEGRSMSEKVSSTQNLVAQFKPEDVLTENFLRSVTQLNSLLQQEDESVKENDVPVSEQESDWVASPQCEDTKTYLAELDKLFAKFPLSTLSQHEDCSHFHSTVSSCADVLNHLLSASNNSLDCEEQVPTYPDETPNNTPASSKGPQRVIQPGSPLSLTLQMPNNTQHLGHSGVMTAESGVLPHVLAASAVTMQQLEVSSQSRAENLFPFRFTSCNQRAKDSESHQPQEQRWSSLYCPTQSLHCTSLHKDNGQSRKAFSGAHPSYSDETT